MEYYVIVIKTHEIHIPKQGTNLVQKNPLKIREFHTNKFIFWNRLIY